MNRRRFGDWAGFRAIGSEHGGAAGRAIRRRYIQGSMRQRFRITKYQKTRTTIAITRSAIASRKYSMATFYSCNGTDARGMLTNCQRQGKRQKSLSWAVGRVGEGSPPPAKKPKPQNLRGPPSGSTPAGTPALPARGLLHGRRLSRNRREPISGRGVFPGSGRFDSGQVLLGKLWQADERLATSESSARRPAWRLRTAPIRPIAL